ncbi:hypothetical protein [Dictyobacter kobayashii]|uniref:hypothetical protein n=1 Tax=Dictyobacter kobayashii TaxID=2014872 RepID=UPI00138719BA|nr:hypothetical protein [Dictyobacter kobayashii]
MVESNLPIVALDAVPQILTGEDSVPFTPVPDVFDDDDDDDDGATVAVAAIKLPLNKK